MPQEALDHSESDEATWSAPTEAEIETALTDLNETGPIKITGEADIDKLPDVDVRTRDMSDKEDAITIEKSGYKPVPGDNVIDLEEARKRLRDIPEK